MVDLTQRRELERRLSEKQKLESIGLLAGDIAHDFNNLLVGVIGNATLIREMIPENSSILDLLNEVVKASERAAHLTKHMLAYSGKGRFVIERVNLTQAARPPTLPGFGEAEGERGGAGEGEGHIGTGGWRESSAEERKVVFAGDQR